MTSFSCENSIFENWVLWNVWIHSEIARNCKKCVVLFKFYSCKFVNVPENEKQSKKWMTTGLWEILWIPPGSLAL